MSALELANRSHAGRDPGARRCVDACRSGRVRLDPRAFGRGQVHPVPACSPGRSVPIAAIRVGGAPLDERSRAFAFMPQRDALMPWRRIIDNVTLGLEVQGLGRAEARARCGRCLQPSGLRDSSATTRRNCRAACASAQRFCAPSCRTARSSLLDEPFGALDALTRAEMQRWHRAPLAARRAGPRFWSPMMCARRWRCPTGSMC
jgi:hypothetical protein